MPLLSFGVMFGWNQSIGMAAKEAAEKLKELVDEVRVDNPTAEPRLVTTQAVRETVKDVLGWTFLITYEIHIAPPPPREPAPSSVFGRSRIRRK